MKLTIRPICHHQPQSSSLPHVDIGPTVSSIFGTLAGSPVLSECQALSAIQPGSTQWYQTGVLLASISFLEMGRSDRVPKFKATSPHVFTRLPHNVAEPEIWTGASCYHNCCVDGSTSPEYFGYHLVVSFGITTCI
jgi:hypothetical protein